ncbi:hypothetical protein, partial [Rhodomicrobium udaipurense]|uniref:hypothetical protein n=1 Tax=Rhodomicrobium udaipurense TaxID=1202716 RepID=UPI001AEC36D4
CRVGNDERADERGVSGFRRVTPHIPVGLKRMRFREGYVVTSTASFLRLKRENALSVEQGRRTIV